VYACMPTPCLRVRVCVCERTVALYGSCVRLSNAARALAAYDWLLLHAVWIFLEYSMAVYMLC
jgi:hypothetical protein